MKKFLAIVLAAIMMVSLATACAGPSSSKPATPASTPASGASDVGGEELTGTLKLWTHQNPAWTTAYQVQIDKFTALHPGVTIEQEAFPYMDFVSKLQTSLVAGDGADVYVIFGSWAADYLANGALAQVPEAMSKRMDEDYYPSATGAFKYDGKYFGIPLEYNIEYGGMLVNKKLFDEKGLTYPTTWAELEKISDDMGVRNGEIMDMRGFEFATYDGITNMLFAMILSQGGQYLNDDGETINITSPEAVEGMTNLVSYAKERDWTNLEGLGNTGEGGMKSLFLDQAMMALVGPWSVAQGITDYELEYGVDYEYAPVPQYGEKNLFAAETGWGCVVPESSKQKDLAFKFLEFISAPENLMEHNIACTQIPPCKSIASDPAYLAALPYTKPIIDILGNGQYMGGMNTDNLKSTLNGVFTELVNGGKYASIEEGLKDAETQINALTTK